MGVERQIERMGNILQQGMAGLGDMKRQEAAAGLERAKLGYQLGADLERRNLERPALQARAQEAQTQLDMMNRPMTMQQLFNTPEDLVWAMKSRSSDGKSMADDFTSSLGLKVGQDGSLVYGDTGRLFSQWDAQQPAAQDKLFETVIVNMDPYKKKDDLKNQFLDVVAQGPENNPQYAQALQGLKQVQQFETSPESELKWLEGGRRVLMPYASRSAAGKARLEWYDKQIEGLQGRIAKRDNENLRYVHDVALVKLQNNFALQRALIDAAGRSNKPLGQYLFDKATDLFKAGGYDNFSQAMDDVLKQHKRLSLQPDQGEAGGLGPDLGGLSGGPAVRAPIAGTPQAAAPQQQPAPRRLGMEAVMPSARAETTPQQPALPSSVKITGDTPQGGIDRNRIEQIKNILRGGALQSLRGQQGIPDESIQSLSPKAQDFLRTMEDNGTPTRYNQQTGAWEVQGNDGRWVQVNPNM